MDNVITKAPVQTEQPFSYAHITLIWGEQGQGKSNTAVARIIEPAIDEIDSLVNIDTGEIIKAESLTHDDKRNLEDMGYTLSYDTVKLHIGGSVRISNIPPRHIINTNLRIFTNYHLYGIRYVFIPSWADILKWLDAGIIGHGRLSIDEYHMGSHARDFMSGFGKQISKYDTTMRKRHLEMDMMTVHARMIDFNARLMKTGTIHCKHYDRKTQMITYEEKKPGEHSAQEHTYYAPYYWKYYWTDELFKPIGGSIDRAIAQSR